MVGCVPTGPIRFTQRAHDVALYLGKLIALDPSADLSGAKWTDALNLMAKLHQHKHAYG